MENDKLWITWSKCTDKEDNGNDVWTTHVISICSQKSFGNCVHSEVIWFAVCHHFITELDCFAFIHINKLYGVFTLPRVKYSFFGLLLFSSSCYCTKIGNVHKNSLMETNKETWSALKIYKEPYSVSAFCRAKYSLSHSQSLRKLMTSFYIYTYIQITDSSAVSLALSHTHQLSQSPTQTTLWLWQQQPSSSYTLLTNPSPSVTVGKSISSLVFQCLSICLCVCVCAGVCETAGVQPSNGHIPNTPKWSQPDRLYEGTSSLQLKHVHAMFTA